MDTFEREIRSALLHCIVGLKFEKDSVLAGVESLLKISDSACTLIAEFEQVLKAAESGHDVELCKGLQSALRLLSDRLVADFHFAAASVLLMICNRFSSLNLGVDGFSYSVKVLVGFFDRRHSEKWMPLDLSRSSSRPDDGIRTAGIALLLGQAPGVEVLESLSAGSYQVPEVANTLGNIALLTCVRDFRDRIDASADLFPACEASYWCRGIMRITNNTGIDSTAYCKAVWDLMYDHYRRFPSGFGTADSNLVHKNWMLNLLGPKLTTDLGLVGGVWSGFALPTYDLSVGSDRK
jgi:hypothetical protein